LYTDINVFMRTHISLGFLIITGTVLSSQATSAQNSFSIMRVSVANNTLKTQVSVVSNATNPDPVAVQTLQAMVNPTSPQTDIFFSDVARIDQHRNKISAIPVETQSEAAVEILVPPPLTRLIKRTSIIHSPQAVKIEPVPSVIGVPTATSAPVSKSSIPIDNGVTQSATTLTYPLQHLAPITSRFGWRTHPLTGNRRFHSGIDIGAPAGTPVVATGSGTVISAGWNGGYGKAVIIQHNDTQQTLYGHLSATSVQVGQTITQGTVIGLVGSTGNSTGPHLHFESRMPIDGVWSAVDPGQEIKYAGENLRRSMPYAGKELPPGI
jgi:murein DD-endopeptidase MepM/ murein hydrolase activator NlpD